MNISSFRVLGSLCVLLMQVIVQQFLLPLVLFLLGSFRELTLQNKSSLLIHITLHSCKGMITHQNQVWVFRIILGSIWKHTQTFITADILWSVNLNVKFPIHSHFSQTWTTESDRAKKNKCYDPCHSELGARHGTQWLQLHNTWLLK